MYNNHGVNLIHPLDRDATVNYFISNSNSFPTDHYDYTCRVFNAMSGYKTIHLCGRVSINEHGKELLYLSLMDITPLHQLTNELQKERDFSSALSALSDTAFFDYDIGKRSMRFSKKFAELLGVPEVIENYPDSDVKRNHFDDTAVFFMQSDIQNSLSKNYARELKVTLANGDIAWYFCSYTIICDIKEKKERLIGKMIDVTGRHAHLSQDDISQTKDMLTDLYNKTTTERLIQDHLNFAPRTELGAFFIIELQNFKDINEQLGNVYSDVCIKEVAELLSCTFRTIDIIGRAGGNKFFVFIKNYKEKAVLERKIQELLIGLEKTYVKQDLRMDLSTSVGVSLYPEDGHDFATLHGKADKALSEAQGGYALYSGTK